MYLLLVRMIIDYVCISVIRYYFVRLVWINLFLFRIVCDVDIYINFVLVLKKLILERWVIVSWLVNGVNGF